MKRQVDRMKTKQVRIDVRLHSQLRIKAAEQGITLRELIEVELGFQAPQDNRSNTEKE